jgi:hypothetical protein
MPTTINFENPSWTSHLKLSSRSPDVYMYRCISPHGMRHGTPYAQSPKRPGDVDVSPLVPSLLAGLLRLRRLSLHTLVHGRLKPYKVQYLGSSGILDTARAQNTHTPYTTYYMNPYIRDTERLVCGSLALASAPLYWFPQSQKYFPGANVFSSVQVYPNIWNSSPPPLEHREGSL